MKPVEYKEFIDSDPEVRFGKPCLKGTRIAVFEVLGWLAAGMSFDEILDEYPELSREMILACLSYSSDRERKVRIAG